MKQHLISLIIVILLSIPAILPLLSPGYFPMHDDTQIERVIVMGRALRNGQFPVRWVSDLGYGYGYPIFNFYGPLAYYVGGFFYMFGVSGLLATKLMMGIGFVLLGCTFYLLVSKIMGKTAGIFAAVLSMYAPYHAVQLFVRGAIGELWVLAFIPLLLLGIYMTLREKKHTIGILLGIIGFSGIILSHTLLGFTSVFFFGIFLLVIYSLHLRRRIIQKDLVFLLYIFLGGLGISAFFWLPAMIEMGYTSVSGQIGPTANVLDHFVCLPQFFYSPWGFGGSALGCADGLSFAIGKSYLIFTLLGAGSLLYSWQNKNIRSVGIFGILLILLSLFFMVEQSSFLWKLIPGFGYIQYPWRFLVYAIVGVCIVSSIFIASIRSNFVRILIAGAGILLVIFINAKLFNPQFIYLPNEKTLESDENIRFRASKLSDEYLPQNIQRPEKIDQVVHQLIPNSELYTVKTVTDKEIYKKAEFLAKQQTKVILNSTGFPGWEIWVNDTKQANELDNGRHVITIPSGFSTLQMWFKNTPVRTIGNIISLITMVLLGYIYGKKTFR